MNTFIISSKNIELADKAIAKINEDNNVSKFDIEIYESEKAFGIDNVKKIQQKIFLKPSSGKRKSVTINLDKGISIEAQNAMLKLLEEPPASSIIILKTPSSNLFLSTVLSRAQIIELSNQTNNNPTDKHFENINGVEEALLLAQNLSEDKNEAISWLEQTILNLRNEMISNISNKKESLSIRKKIHKFEIAHYDLKNTNINVRLTLENLFLNLINSGNR